MAGVETRESVAHQPQYQVSIPLNKLNKMSYRV